MVSSSPSARPDTVYPTVGAVSASRSVIEPENCRYGDRTSTIAATVTDNRSNSSALRVTFQYTLGGVTSTVRMTSAGQGAFEGTLGPLPMPRDIVRIAVFVTGRDAAGNSTQSASPAYVTLYPTCSPG